MKDAVQPKDFQHQIVVGTGLPAREHRVYRRFAIGDLKPFRELADDGIASPPGLHDMRQPATGRGDEANVATNEGAAERANVGIVRPQHSPMRLRMPASGVFMRRSDQRPCP
jgi:hypothetical protein